MASTPSTPVYDMLNYISQGLVNIFKMGGLLQKGLGQTFSFSFQYVY